MRSLAIQRYSAFAAITALVTTAVHAANTGLDLAQHLRIGKHDVDLHQLGEVEDLHGRRNRYVGSVVEVETQHLSFGLHHAGDPESRAGNPDELAESVLFAK